MSPTIAHHPTEKGFAEPQSTAISAIETLAAYAL
jgi:hypothetical protein